MIQLNFCDLIEILKYKFVVVPEIKQGVATSLSIKSEDGRIVLYTHLNPNISIDEAGVHDFSNYSKSIKRTIKLSGINKQ